MSDDPSVVRLWEMDAKVVAELIYGNIQGYKTTGLYAARLLYLNQLVSQGNITETSDYIPMISAHPLQRK